MNFFLPKTVDIDGAKYSIRYDYRVILEIITMLSDTDLKPEEKGMAILEMFYVDYEKIRNVQEAIEKCYWFIDCGNESKKNNSPRLMDWEQDFPYIIAPVNRVLGYDARGVDYDVDSNTGGLHWWTFVSAYMEIGADTTISQIISLRSKMKKGKKLEKWEREWIRSNYDAVHIHTNYSDTENEIINQWTKG